MTPCTYTIGRYLPGYYLPIFGKSNLYKGFSQENAHVTAYETPYGTVYVTAYVTPVTA